MLPVLQIGPLAVQFPGLLLLAGIWLGTVLVEREAPRRKLSAEVLTNLIFYALVAAVLGARLGYALRFLDVYLQEPLGLFSLNPSTLAVPEGVAVGLIVALVYGQRRELPLWPTLDALTPALAAFSIFVGLAHLASGDAFGAPTAGPLGIELWGARRHPTQIYEVLVALGLFVVVHRLKGRMPISGGLFSSWVGLAATGRLLLEALRGDSVIVLDGLRQAQMVSLAVLLAAMIGLHWLSVRQGKGG